MSLCNSFYPFYHSFYKLEQYLLISVYATIEIILQKIRKKFTKLLTDFGRNVVAIEIPIESLSLQFFICD